MSYIVNKMFNLKSISAGVVGFTSPRKSRSGEVENESTSEV